MSSSKRKHTLLAGRAGEITDIANPLTFSLLEKIFGQYGPYRKTLREFGVYCADTANSFLEYKRGKVYSVLEKENQILWKNYPFKLEFLSGKVVTKVSLANKNIIKVIPYFLVKTICETKIIIQIDKFLEKADKAYKSFCQKSNKACENMGATVNDFLKDYEYVIYISYLYEFVFAYNQSQNFSTEAFRKPTSEYIKHNDYLLYGSEKLAENYFKLENGFILGSQYERKDLEERNLDNVPDSIPNFKGAAPSTFKAELKLQCMKNNLRLKTNLYLYFVNKNLERKTSIAGIKEFEYLEIDEIENIGSYAEYIIEEKIKASKGHYNPEEASKLPNVLVESTA